MKPVELVFQNRSGAMEQQMYPWHPEMTVRALIDLSGCYAHHPYLEGRAVGIFSQTVEMDSVVSPGDRVEIYAPLKCDPKEARRSRVKKKK
jgi:hypothetical protein